jgi:LPS export ABC transporter protein LptC
MTGFKIFAIKKTAALVTGCFFLYSCENKLSDIENFNKKSTGRDEAKNVVIKYSIGGKRKALLTGPLMYRVSDTANYVEFPKAIHVDFYNEATDSIESRLDARYAKYQDAQSRVFLRDSVRVINVLGDTLYCNELYWDRSKTKHEFYTDKPVRIRRKMEIIDGIGMDASQDFTEWHIVQSTGFLKVPNSQFPN